MELKEKGESLVLARIHTFSFGMRVCVTMCVCVCVYLSVCMCALPASLFLPTYISSSLLLPIASFLNAHQPPPPFPAPSRSLSLSHFDNGPCRGQLARRCRRLCAADGEEGGPHRQPPLRRLHLPPPWCGPVLPHLHLLHLVAFGLFFSFSIYLSIYIFLSLSFSLLCLT